MATLTRREAFQLFGLSAAAVAAAPMEALAQAPTFPKGAIIHAIQRLRTRGARRRRDSFSRAPVTRA